MLVYDKNREKQNTIGRLGIWNHISELALHLGYKKKIINDDQ